MRPVLGLRKNSPCDSTIEHRADRKRSLPIYHDNRVRRTPIHWISLFTALHAFRDHTYGKARKGRKVDSQGLIERMTELQHKSLCWEQPCQVEFQCPHPSLLLPCYRNRQTESALVDSGFSTKDTNDPVRIATLLRVALLAEKHKNSDSPALFVGPVIQSFMQLNRIEDPGADTIVLLSILDHAAMPIPHSLSTQRHSRPNLDMTLWSQEGLYRYSSRQRRTTSKST